MSDGFSFADFEVHYPDHEIIHIRSAMPSVDYPNGFTGVMMVPKKKIAEVLAAGGNAPTWRHGEIIDIKPAAPW